MYPDAFGVRPVLQQIARELAGHGYYVLVPNLYYRHGPAPVTGYCIGAVLAVRTAAAHPGQVAAVAGFHPFFLVTGAPDSPHRHHPRFRYVRHRRLQPLRTAAPLGPPAPAPRPHPGQ
jgi:dienelactone hydrolase